MDILLSKKIKLKKVKKKSHEARRQSKEISIQVKYDTFLRVSCSYLSFEAVGFHYEKQIVHSRALCIG